MKKTSTQRPVLFSKWQRLRQWNCILMLDSSLHLITVSTAFFLNNTQKRIDIGTHSLLNALCVFFKIKTKKCKSFVRYQNSSFLTSTERSKRNSHIILVSKYLPRNIKFFLWLAYKLQICDPHISHANLTRTKCGGSLL